LALALAAGLAVGFIAHAVFFAPVPAPAAPASRLVMTDPSKLVVQPEDLPPSYRVGEEQGAAQPVDTHPRARYSITISRTDSSHYLAQCAVNTYESMDKARAALQALLGVGQFGTELALHRALGDEGHLYAAKDEKAMVVIGSALWRERNAVAYVFVYNPYSSSTPAEELDRLARGNAYDDTLALATRMAERISATA
jgi:hypothetical protein